MGISYTTGLAGLMLGGYLIDSAIQNRAPVGTLIALLRNPGDVRGTLATQKRPADSFAAQGTGAGDWSGPTQVGPAPTDGSWGQSAQADKAIAFARAQLGKPYSWGATGPNAYDCSGLVQAAYRAAGVNLPRVTQAMILSGTAGARTDLVPGDLVCPDIGHVQIYTNNGNVIEAPSAGKVVREVAMWGFMAARRVVAATPLTPAAPSGGGLIQV